MAKKLYEENNIKDIANAIRQKGVSGTFKPSEMADAILNIKSGGEEQPILENLTVDKNGTYTPNTGVDGFNKVTVNSACFWHNPSPYLDDDGKFVKPDEWDDIESIELADNAQEVYYLYDNTKSLSWCSIKVTTSSSNSFCDYGRVRNGVFETLLTETKSSGSSYQKVFTDTFPDEDYIVLRFRPTTGKNLTRVEVGGNYTYNGRALTSSQQPLLMRYGNMPHAQIITCNIYNLVSDNLMNCRELTTLGSLYNGCNMLVRHRHTGWDTSNVTNISSMFSNCYCLVDCDTDFSGWLSGGKCTTLSSFMNNCFSLRGEVDVTDWVTDNVTTIQTLFYSCRNITRLKGIEGWYLPKVVLGTNHYPLNQMFSLEQENGVLDLRNWRLGENVTSTQNFTNFFDTMRKIKEINISTWNMSYVSSLNNFCATCYSLQKITLPNDIGSGGLLTNINGMFNNCYSIESIDFSSIDMSKVQTLNTAIGAACYSLKEFIPPTTTPVGTSNSSAFGSFGGYSLLETLDLSWVDASKFTNSSAQINDIVKQAMYLKELYPPRNIFKAFNVGTAPNLSKASLLRIIENLSTVSSATTLTLGTTNLAKLTADEIAVATGKGWTVA